MIVSIFLSFSILFYNQYPLLNESFTDPEFPPPGWDTLRSDTFMTNWYRYNYTGTQAPDSFHARVRVYDASDTLRTGWATLKTPQLNISSTPGSESLFFWYRFSATSGNLGPDDTMYIDITNDEMIWYNLLKIDQSDEDTAWQIPQIDLLPYDTFSNARLRFHYEDKPNDSLSQWNRNFWLDSVKVLTYGAQYIWPIAQAFRDLDSNRVPDLLDTVVTITGVITAPPGIFSDLEAYIQDSTAGVCLFGDFPVTLDYGDSIIATGTVDQYRGKNELTDFTYSIVQQNATIPHPIEIDGSIMNTEYYEGSLVKIKVSYIDGFVLEGNEEYNAWDTLNNLFTIWIDSYTNIPGSIAPMDTFTLVGIKGQYSYSVPPNDGYQLMPRDTLDFSHFFIMPEIKDIQEVQSTGPDGVGSKYVDSLVAVEGVITGPDYIFSSGTPSFYIQDETAGINIYNADGDEQYENYIDSLGARIRVIGTVTEYNGLTEIAYGYGWFLGMDTVPLPKELAANRFLTEGMEGSLIKLKGVIKTTPYKTGDGYNFDILNGDVGITIRFTTATGINPTGINKDEEKVITGIVGQYDPEAPYTTGYQVLLRFPEDFNLPEYDSASAVPLITITGPKTFIPSIGEQAEIRINSPNAYRLDLSVHDMSYKVVKSLYSGAGGPHTIHWDGKDDIGKMCKIGIYLLNLKVIAPAGKSTYKRTLIVLGTRF